MLGNISVVKNQLLSLEMNKLVFEKNAMPFGAHPRSFFGSLDSLHACHGAAWQNSASFGCHGKIAFSL
jgi:hypothetical protein